MTAVTEHVVTYSPEVVLAPPFGVWHPVGAHLEVRTVATDGLGAIRVRERQSSPQVTVNPAINSGVPSINGHPLDAVAGLTWQHGVDYTAEDLDLTRAQVLVGCWYAGIYGLPGRRASLTPTRLWRNRWGRWADDVGGLLWQATTVDYEHIPDPPRKATT